MELPVICIFIIAHIFFDFLFQSKKIVLLRFGQGMNKSERIKNSIRGNSVHAIEHFLAALILLEVGGISLGFKLPILPLIYVSIFHFIVDFSKSTLIILKPYLQNNIWIFLLDQGLHFAFITYVVFGFDTSKAYSKLEGKFFDFPINLMSYEKNLLIIVFFLISVVITATFVRIFISHLEFYQFKELNKKGFTYPKKGYTLGGVQNGGYFIGILERILIVLLISMKQPSILGFVLAVKSIARFKKLEDEGFAEYFIIGTFISFIAAIIGGLLIGKLL